MSNRKILLADDDAEDREIIRDAMEAVNAEQRICFVENGEQALHELDRSYNAADPPCLIVLDLNMPRLNGTETLRRLKSDGRFENIPVIIFSTSINTFEKEKCMSLGAASYITKPVSYDECLQTVNTFLSFCKPAPAAN